ncbi:4152_t:CDS:2, partial [Dentiscutata erythropus]
MVEIRNILLIGSAGKGKSTLANVLTETNEFEESEGRIHGTKESKSKEFEYEGIKYQEEIEAFNLLSKVIFDDKETKKFSEQLAHTKIIYVDNPPAKGRYLSISKGSREESRKKLLTHLKTWQE